VVQDAPVTRLPRPARCVVVLAVLLVLSVASGRADAATWSQPDPRGDGSGYTFSPDPEPCGTFETTPGVSPTVDVTRLRVQHRRQVIRVEVSFADLRHDPRQSTTVHLLTAAGDTDVELFTARGKLRAWWFPGAQTQQQEDADAAGSDCSFSGVYEGGRCPGLRAVSSPSRDRLTLTAPRACLDRPRWVRAGVTSSTDVDGRFEVDRWAPADDDDAGPAVYGAKVRAPRS